MICNQLIPRLRQKYAGSGVRFGSPPDPIAVFPAKHLSVGELSIYDDGYEITICIGEITHGHFSPDPPGLTQDAIETQITEDVLGFLEDMFADQYLLWKSQDHRRGGWQHLEYTDLIPLETRQDANYFVWSEPFVVA